MAGVNKRPARSGTDWSRYTPFSYSGNTVLSTPDVLETAFSVTGQGYLSNVISAPNLTEGNDIKLKVTIDGVVVLFEISATESNPIGIIQEEAMDGAQLRSVNGVDSFTMRSYPRVDDTSDGVCVMGEKIFFNTSLLIELLEISSVSTGGVAIRYNGGYIA